MKNNYRKYIYNYMIDERFSFLFKYLIGQISLNRKKLNLLNLNKKNINYFLYNSFVKRSKIKKIKIIKNVF